MSASSSVANNHILKIKEDSRRVVLFLYFVAFFAVFELEIVSQFCAGPCVA